MKKICIILLSTCIIFSSQLYTLYTHAQNATTKAEVEFIAGQGPTYPVNPEDPEIPGNGGGVDGSFAIVCVSDFYFGSIEVMASDGFYDIDLNRPNIQVVDLRGSGNGWKVSTKVSRFTRVDPETETEIETLPGAEILIKNGRPKSLSVSLPPIQLQDVALPTDGEITPLIVAPKEAGTGLWVMRWYPADYASAYIQLHIPAGTATIGNHTARINWILEDTPS